MSFIGDLQLPEAGSLVSTPPGAPPLPGYSALGTDSAGNLVAFAAGNAGQVLRSRGALQQPQFENFSSTGIWTFTIPVTMVSNTGYFVNGPGSAVMLLPPLPVIGDSVSAVITSSNTFQINVNIGQSIFIGRNATTNGVLSSDFGDALTLVYASSGRWFATSVIGNITLL